jgi:hypothetical protein
LLGQFAPVIPTLDDHPVHPYFHVFVIGANAPFPGGIAPIGAEKDSSLAKFDVILGAAQCRHAPMLFINPFAVKSYKVWRLLEQPFPLWYGLCLGLRNPLAATWQNFLRRHRG